jgi:hypothetical protein
MATRIAGLPRAAKPNNPFSSSPCIGLVALLCSGASAGSSFAGAICQWH